MLLVTIDTLRADHVGAYGYAAARTPALDRIAREGVRFNRAYAPAPITLPSHASILSGRYPAGHASRDNGMAVAPDVPTLATVLHDRGLRTGAFVAAFPLDRRFGLARGFDVYGDRMPRDASGKLLNERPGSQVVDEALAWVGGLGGAPFFLWVHFFEPHAPYGNPQQAGGRSALERYDEEIATADAQVGRLLDGLGDATLRETLVVVAGDHGESFGEHGELTHSIFVYDTTLRVPWVMMGPGVGPASAALDDPVCLIDVAPTVLGALGIAKIDTDGVDVRAIFTGGRLAARDLYAESYAPLLEFGWSALNSVRSGSWKAISAPRPELYDIERNPGETTDLAADRREVVRQLVERAGRYSGPPPDLASREGPATAADAQTVARLHALGYLQGTRREVAGTGADPKDRREQAARMAAIVSGEVQGPTLEADLETVLREDPGNLQAHLRLGDYLISQRRCAEAERHFSAAVAGRLPSADPYLGLATCQAARGDAAGAEGSLQQADRVEPGNPVIQANLGILQAKAGRGDAAIRSLKAALALDADLHEARFNLALAYARAGRRSEAKAEVEELLRRLPAAAPQRPEVQRLLAALR